MSTTTLSCGEQLQLEIRNFKYGIYVSLGFTLLVLILRQSVYFYNNINNNNVTRFYLVAGFIKLLIALALMFVLLPTCPEGCTCDNDDGGDDGDLRLPSHPFYPFVALGIALLWLGKAYKSFHSTTTTATTTTIEDFVDTATTTITTTTTTKDKGGKAVFKSVPTVEIV